MEWFYAGMIAIVFLAFIFMMLFFGLNMADKNEEEMNRILNRWPKDGK